MEAKEAYQQLLDEREGRGRTSGTNGSSGFGAGRAGSTSAGSSSGWGYRGSGTGGGAGVGGYGRPPPPQPRWQPAEEAYSFGECLLLLTDAVEGAVWGRPVFGYSCRQS